MILTRPEFVVLVFFAAVGFAGFVCVVGLVVLYGLMPERAADDPSYPIQQVPAAALDTPGRMTTRESRDSSHIA